MSTSVSIAGFATASAGVRFVGIDPLLSLDFGTQRVRQRRRQLLHERPRRGQNAMARWA